MQITAIILAYKQFPSVCFNWKRNELKLSLLLFVNNEDLFWFEPFNKKTFLHFNEIIDYVVSSLSALLLFLPTVSGLAFFRIRFFLRTSFNDFYRVLLVVQDLNIFT